jgi:hypothetical protein
MEELYIGEYNLHIIYKLMSRFQIWNGKFRQHWDYDLIDAFNSFLRGTSVKIKVSCIFLSV